MEVAGGPAITSASQPAGRQKEGGEPCFLSLKGICWLSALLVELKPKATKKLKNALPIQGG